eukprot:250576-Pyramimonas_sp.AAC.1
MCLRLVYFNKDHPQNHTIRKRIKKDWCFEVFEDGEWNRKMVNEVLPVMREKLRRLTTEFRHEFLLDRVYEETQRADTEGRNLLGTAEMIRNVFISNLNRFPCARLPLDTVRFDDDVTTQKVRAMVIACEKRRETVDEWLDQDIDLCDGRKHIHAT